MTSIANPINPAVRDLRRRPLSGSPGTEDAGERVGGLSNLTDGEDEMYGHNLVAVYGSRDQAERARDRLLDSGFPPADLRISPALGAEPVTMGAEPVEGALSPKRHEGFWDWLLGRDVPQSDRDWYEANLRDGRTALSVLIRNDAEHDRALDIMEEFDPVDIDHGTEAATPSGLVAGAPIGRSHDFEHREGPADTRAGIAPGPMPRTGEAEQVVPLVQEELDIGKRASERRYRVRTYVVEHPVEEQVRLRDERVVIEHRPVSGERAAAPGDFQEREFEVVERHEEPVVGKRTRATEEVVVRREANERVETVRDTVRETKVDLDKDPTRQETGAEPAEPPIRRP